jgi:hypothetical protein
MSHHVSLNPIVEDSIRGTPTAQNPHNQFQMNLSYTKYLQVYSESLEALEMLRCGLRSIKEKDTPPPDAPVPVWHKFRVNFNKTIRPLRETYQKKLSEFKELEHRVVVLQTQQKIYQEPAKKAGYR